VGEDSNYGGYCYMESHKKWKKMKQVRQNEGERRRRRKWRRRSKEEACMKTTSWEKPYVGLYSTHK
jgi:hypothetical protein